MTTKTDLRRMLRAQRASRGEGWEAATGAALAGHANALPQGTLTAFVGTRGEVSTVPLLDALIAGGSDVLLPVALPDGVLDWAPYTGREDLVPAERGLLEPTAPRRGAEAILAADAVLVPALALDRRGGRLGQGGGYYDRILPRYGGLVIGIVADDEVLDEVPVEPHDQRVAAILTPGGGLELLGEGG
jgi:5-formyltetrahydrofolate cyclo-ligase